MAKHQSNRQNNFPPAPMTEDLLMPDADEMETRWDGLHPEMRKKILAFFGDYKLHNIEAEQAVLGVVMANNNAYWSVPDLKAYHFHDPIHKEVYTMISDFMGEGKIANPVTMKNYFDQYQDDEKIDLGGMTLGEYLVRLVGSALVVLDVRDYAEVIIDLAVRRQIASTLRESYGDLITMTSTVTSKEISSRVIDKMIEHSDEIKGVSFHSIHDVNVAIVEQMSKQLPCFSTGIPVLDKAMGGGVYLRKSYCITARPKMGKTLMMSSIFTNIAEAGVAVCYICAEMGELEIQQRALARMLHCNSIDFIAKRNDDNFINRAAEFVVQKQRKPGLYVDAPGISFADLKQVVQLAVRKHKVKVIFLDYVQLVTGKTDSRQSEASFQEEVTAWIAKAVRKLDVSIVYATQNNRGGEIRGSDGALMAADWLYELVLKEDNMAYMKFIASRYTMKSDIGTSDNPALWKYNHGPCYRDITEKPDYGIPKSEQVVTESRRSTLFMDDLDK